MRCHGVALCLVMVALAGCDPGGGAPAVPPVAVDVCANGDGALAESAFVIATDPGPGDRVQTGFPVRGCSRTFESTVVWRLLGLDGTVLASGFTQGGGVDGPGPFAFTVPYQVSDRQIGHLEVYEEDASDGEGHPPGRTVIPLVLRP